MPFCTCNTVIVITHIITSYIVRYRFIFLIFVLSCHSFSDVYVVSVSAENA